MQPPYYRGCWHGVSRCLFWRYRPGPSLLGQTHFVPPKRTLQPRKPSSSTRRRCVMVSHISAIFHTAAPRRSLGRISVPVWPIILSNRLPIIALVGHYPTNKLIGREPLPRKPLDRNPSGLWSGPDARTGHYSVLASLSTSYPKSGGRLLTCYSPVRRSTNPPKGTFALDLHV